MAQRDIGNMFVNERNDVTNVVKINEDPMD